MGCFTKVMNKMYDFDDVLPTSVSLPAWALQKIVLKVLIKWIKRVELSCNIISSSFLRTYFGGGGVVVVNIYTDYGHSHIVKT